MFSDLTSLKSVSFNYGSECKYIGSKAFYNCTKLTKATVVVNKDRFDLSESMFEGCTSLSEVILSDNIDYIRRRAFAGCSALTSITLPSELKCLSSYVFEGAGLTSITIPSKVGRNLFTPISATAIPCPPLKGNPRLWNCPTFPLTN